MINLFSVTSRSTSILKWSRGLSVTNSLVDVTIDNNKIGYITLNNPTELNALSEEMGDKFSSVVQELIKAAAQQKVRAVILSGNGKSFSAGGNLAWLKERHSCGSFENSRIMQAFYRRFLCLKDIPVPTIAAIHGNAIGAGCCLTLACDFRLVGSSSILGFTFPKLGIHPGMGATLLLPRTVSTEYSSFLLLTGQTIRGEEAVKRGLALEIHEDSKLFDRAKDLAVVLAENSPIAIQGTLQTLRNKKFYGLDDALVREADAQAIAYSSTDYLKGIEAVKNKKKATFEGWD